MKRSPRTTAIGGTSRGGFVRIEIASNVRAGDCATAIDAAAATIATASEKAAARDG
jgi:hypothetical protein